jgi:NAD(P)H-dependent FMN reductase
MMLAIIWHSRTGAAQDMAVAALDGAQSAGTAALVPAEQATPDVLLQSSGYLFVCPENLASMSGAMKEFFDRCYYPLLGRIEGRPYATLIAAGSDGTGAERQIDRIATGWRLRRIADGIIVNLQAQTPDAIMAAKNVPANALQRCRELGEGFAAALEQGIF